MIRFVVAAAVLLIGTCVRAEEQDLQKICANTRAIVDSISNFNDLECLNIFFKIVMEETSYTEFCSSLVAGLACTARKIVDQPYQEECKNILLAHVKANYTSIFAEIHEEISQLGFTVNETYVNKTAECKELEHIGKPPEPDFSVCVSADKIMQVVLDVTNTECLFKFQAVVVEQNTFPEYCSALMDGLNCSAQKLVDPPHQARCFDKMLRHLKVNYTSIFKELEQTTAVFGITFNKNYTNQTYKCKQLAYIENDTHVDDKVWNTSCPKMNHVGGLCPSGCKVDTDCPKPNTVCCNVGGEQCRACIPDLKRCADVDLVFHANCTESKLQSLLSQDRREAFCSEIWDILKCSAQGIVGDDYSKLCFERIALLLKYEPSVLLRKTQTYLSSLPPLVSLVNMRRFAGDLATECKDSPLYEKPSRPVSDDVKECSVLETIQQNIGQCGRITASRASNAVCSQLKTLIYCIAKKIVANADDHVVSKCAGQIYRVVRENRQQLTNTFGSLASNLCEEREAVCGEDQKPLDGINCTTSRCPGAYVCRNSYCCPEEREGMCPRNGSAGSAMCFKTCKMDSECGEDEKCCMSVACRNKTCMPIETKDKSQCDTEFENGRKQLEKQGICGDNRRQIKLPNCQNSGYSPFQININTGRGHCVDTENGTRIRGSEFYGIKDCFKVREGKCPAPPKECGSGVKVENICQSNDYKCKPGEKCCLDKEGDYCVRVCRKAEEAPEDEPDDCADRKCCPFTLCQDKKCPADITAVCRINSCGGCKAEFYNLDGKVDCNAGVPLCRRQRADAQEENARRRHSDDNRLYSFLASRDRNERENEWEEDYMEMSDDDSYEDDDEMMTDEYGDWREDEDSLPDDYSRDGEEEDGEESMQMREYAQRRICDVFRGLGICKNGGECSVGTGESFFEFCKCPSGYYGLLCGQKGMATPMSTHCYRNIHRIKTLHGILMGIENTKAQMIIQHLFSKLRLPDNVMPEYSCDEETGTYEGIQKGTLLPKTGNMVQIYYCVDKTNGQRMEGTQVTLVKSGKMPNCDLTVMPDPMRLPRRCLAMKMEACKEGEPCQYFWNQASGMCEKGKAGGAFNTLNNCFDKCGINMGCTNNPVDMVDESMDECEMGIISGPKPCRMPENNEEDRCDYNRQFCNVEETTTGYIGSCKDFQSYCLQRPDRGNGNMRIGAYYYNATKRTCEKFTYTGHGGNKNRFSTLHQCQTECGTRSYKYEDVVCPVPRRLAMSRMDLIPVDMCDNDYHCYGNQVCCSSGNVRLCTDPIETCLSMRCSMNAACVGGRCVCIDCSDVPKAEVCGSDGKTYDSECHLQRYSCLTMHNITVLSTGPCPKCGDTYCKNYEECENNKCVAKCPMICTLDYRPVCGRGVSSGTYRTFSNECGMRSESCSLLEKFIKVKDGCCNTLDMSDGCQMTYCSKEYKPYCVYDVTENEPQLANYSNLCLIKEAVTYGRKLMVLHPGVCENKCNPSCQVMETCINNTCGCQMACSKEYKPVCAHSITSGSSAVSTFSNVCVMRREACTMGQTYIIVGEGPCKQPEPEYECPETRVDIEGSARINCDMYSHAGCDKEMGQMCCPYGSGTKCLSKKVLVRRKMMKSGICPNIFGLNYQRSWCPDAHCMDDSDCSGDAKCCSNPVCGHMTCVEPAVKDDKKYCGANSRIMSTCNPNMIESGCPSGATCKLVEDTEDQVSVCCMPTAKQDAEKSLMNAMLCHLMEVAGVMCENGGTCLGDFYGEKVCQCKTGYYGDFCEAASPPFNPVPPSRCLTQKAILMALSKTGLIPDGPSWDDFERDQESGEMERKRRDDHMDEDEDDEMEGYQEMDEDELNPLLMKLIQLMRHLGIHGLPTSVANLCTNDGKFKQEQCVRNIMTGEHYCYCVNPDTGKAIPNGPKEADMEDLTCGDLSEDMGVQGFCLSDKPSMEMCGDSMTERFYYNPVSMDCEMFTDYGCNENVRNNFPSYKACATGCGVGSNSRSICDRVRCGSGKVCRVKHGNATCVDPDAGNSRFEPVCDKDGKFHPKQCNDDMCVCVDQETGETIANSEAEGPKLKCIIEGGTVREERKEAIRCSGNKAVFCKNGGDKCNNCQLKDNMENERGTDSKVDSNNVCKNCQSCPANQGGRSCKVPEKYCEHKCKSFPSAECSFNTCTCKEEYMANDRIVNCSAAQSQCLIEQHMAKQQERAVMLTNGGNQPANSLRVLCTPSGGYKAKCKGNYCNCSNAVNGNEVEGTRATQDQLNCDSVQRKSDAVAIVIEITFATDKRCNDLGRAKPRMETNLKRRLRRNFLNADKLMCSDGSIIYGAEVTIDKSETDGVAETTHLASLVNSVITEVHEGDFMIDVDGEEFIAVDASVTDIVTAEELYGPVTEKVPDDDDESMTTTIIIVVVVVVVVAILAIAVACYCYRKTNRNNDKDIPFSDIQGQSNPAYSTYHKA